MIFTIAIPVYNGEKALEKTIKSALNQNFSFPYEILISNNGSTDGSGKLIEKYIAISDKIRVINRTDTVPMYENHNICLREALGDYVVFCHADDFLTEDCLSKFHHILKNRDFPSKYVLWGRSMFRDFYPAWQVGGVGLNTVLSGQKAILPFVFGGLAPSGVCYSRASFANLNGFCKANLKLTPFDMSTMFKLVIEGFEFEMADRLFLIRTFATTSRILTTKLINENVYDALTCLRSELSPEKFNFLVSTIHEFKMYSHFVLNFLVKEKLMSKKVFFKYLTKRILSNPLTLFNRRFYSEVVAVM
jgi:glycosyltransferase involved in cell wall biosynthesis